MRLRATLGFMTILALAAWVQPRPAAADDTFALSQVREDTEWLASFESRMPGTAGHDQARGELLEKIQAIPGIRMWVHPFSVIVPQTKEATLTVSSGPWKGAHPLYPLWPALVRPNTTPEGGIEGRLVYVGKAAVSDLPARSLRGQVAVMEMTGGGGWMTAYNAGARAILLLGSPEESYADATSHLYALAINVPRFYIPDGPLAAALRKGEVEAGRLVARVDWVEAEATNVYALVPRRAEAPPRRAIAVGVAWDSLGVAPDLAPGADAAVDAATALNALRYFAQHPAEQPLLFVFADAYGLNQRGVREMLAALAVPPSEREDDVKENDDQLAEYRRYDHLAADFDIHPDWLGRMSEEKYRPLHPLIKDEVAREVIAILMDMERYRTAIYSAGGDEKKRLEEAIRRLGLRRGEFLAAQGYLVSGAAAQEDIKQLASTLWERARGRIAKQLQETKRRVTVDWYRDHLRCDVLRALGLGDEEKRPLSFLLGLDLSDSGPAVGPSLMCHYWHQKEQVNAQEFVQWLTKVAKDEGPALWPGDLARAVNLRPLEGLEPPECYTAGTMGNLSSPAESFGTAGATWATLDGLRARVETAGDRADRLDWNRLGPQVLATMAMLKRLASETEFSPASVNSGWCRVRGQIVDQVPGQPVARLPMEGYLATLVNGDSEGGEGWGLQAPFVAGIRREEFRVTGADGFFYFDAMPYLVANDGSWWTIKRFFVQAYRLGPHGEIRRAVDMRKQAKGVSLNVSLGPNAAPLRAIAFSCGEVTGLEFFDPRYLQTLPRGMILDARSGSAPQRINFNLYYGVGVLSCQLEPEVRWALLLRPGVTQNSMVLLNLAGENAGANSPASSADGAAPETPPEISLQEAVQGFRVGEPLPAPPVYLAAKDFYHLDRRRMEDYARAGITSKPIEELQKRTEAMLGEAECALASDNGAAFFRGASGALANEVRVYEAVCSIAKDVVRGAVLLLLVLVPFSLALERLLVATPRIYHQIAATAGIFVVMMGILWSFHPAFRISSQPLMIVLAFAIIFMSLLVIGMIYSRFSSALEEIRSGRAEAVGARTSRLGVLYTAMRLGLANMRKRKLRTALTGLTVILITFALLCFMSASSYTGQREFRLQTPSPPRPSILIRPPSGRPMPGLALRYLENAVGPSKTVVSRYWWCSGDPQWRLHIRNPKTGQTTSLMAALGLEGGEADITGVDRLCPNWPRFAQEGGCYLAQQMAEQLGVRPGDRVEVAGRSLELLGVIDSTRFDTEMKDLEGTSLLPINYSILGDEQRNLLSRADSQIILSEVEQGTGMEPARDLPHLSSAEIILVPAKMLIPLGASLRSAAVRTATPAEAEQLAMDLAKRIGFPIYYGAADGAHVVATTPLLPKAPKSLLIPLVIAGFIIFYTMLSSIAERKREIYIYTSLGLAPVHVGALFLAEAATYGLMGAVFGYIVGQGVATALSHFGWLGGLTLNYSGTQAIATMLLVLVVVILSSLVPAFMAGKLAVPSNKMTWSVPRPQQGVIRDTLPFTVTARTADGVVAFLLEYFDAHREGSIGHFSTDNLRIVRAAAGGVERLSLEGTVWLAPYDLGVRQEIRLTIVPTEDEDIYEIHIELLHQSGQESSWWSLNRVFLGDLRRQLLGWRNLKTERVLAYIRQAAEWRQPPATER